MGTVMQTLMLIMDWPSMGAVRIGCGHGYIVVAF